MQTSTPAHDIDLAALAGAGDRLLPEINQLREHDPLYWSEASRCWIVSGHAEVVEGFSGQLPLSSGHMPEALYRMMPKEELYAKLPNSMRYMPLISTNLDGEQHARLRRVLLKAVNRKLVESLRPYVEHRVAMLLDKAVEQPELEYHEQISRMLPGAVILKLLGMSPDYLARLKGWADGVTTALTSFDPKPEWLYALEVVVCDMLEVFAEEIKRRQAEPGLDLISQLLAAAKDEDGLTMDDVLGTLVQITIAGHDTTSNSISLGTRALARNPEAWTYWRDHPESRVDCAVEVMRHIAMSAAMQRLASEDFDWRGRHIRRGDLVVLLIAGGNRDPLVFQQPENIDFTRQNDAAMTFGPGLHHCVGHLLAKLQVSEFFNALVQRFDRVEILEEPTFSPTLIFRSLTGLQVRFHPRVGS